MVRGVRGVGEAWKRPEVKGLVVVRNAGAMWKLKILDEIVEVEEMNVRSLKTPKG